MGLRHSRAVTPKMGSRLPAGKRRDHERNRAQAAFATERMPWASSLTSEVTAETVFSVALP